MRYFILFLVWCVSSIMIKIILVGDYDKSSNVLVVLSGIIGVFLTCIFYYLFLKIIEIFKQ